MRIENYKVIAIIPARGGSKGIHRKNIFPIKGRPLISYTIEAAQKAKCISKVIISTDDNEIAAISNEWGAEVIVRPDEISADDSPSELALLHVLDKLEKTGNEFPDIIVFLQCTSPLTTPDDIDETVNKLISEDADSAFTVAPFYSFIWKKNTMNEAIPVHHDKMLRKRRQDIEPMYIETGAVYAMMCKEFIKYRHRFFGKTVMHITPRERVLEIDEISDLIFAEYLLGREKEEKVLEYIPRNIDGICFDFDGVFTNNLVLTCEDGYEGVICSRSDGMGIEAMHKLGIPMIVISKEKNEVVRARCEKLNLPYIQGADTKISDFSSWIFSNGFDANNVIYLGNDINDVECLSLAGCGIVVNDAHPEAKCVADIILPIAGGNGAVRYLSDLIKKRNEKHE